MFTIHQLLYRKSENICVANFQNFVTGNEIRARGSKVALFPGHSQILSRSCRENSGDKILSPEFSNIGTAKPRDKIWEWPGDEASSKDTFVAASSSQRHGRVRKILLHPKVLTALSARVITCFGRHKKKKLTA